MQTKWQSFVEAFFNTLTGYIIAVSAQVLVFPWFGVHLPLHENMIMVAIFTAISVVRSYLWRRYFNRRHAVAREVERVRKLMEFDPPKPGDVWPAPPALHIYVGDERVGGSYQVPPPPPPPPGKRRPECLYCDDRKIMYGQTGTVPCPYCTKGTHCRRCRDEKVVLGDYPGTTKPCPLCGTVTEGDEQ